MIMRYTTCPGQVHGPSRGGNRGTIFCHRGLPGPFGGPHCHFLGHLCPTDRPRRSGLVDRTHSVLRRPLLRFVDLYLFRRL
jgi:hypothetical protein